jgi:hypothetical protein
MKSYETLLNITRQKLLKALHHLSYSYNKIQSLSIDVDQLDEENLETWESFATRFARVADIFLARYVRNYVLLNDPGFEGTLRDFVNQAEKLRIIDDANAWMGIRELRNITSHDYSEEDLTQFFARLKKETPRLLAIQEKIHAFNQNGN